MKSKYENLGGGGGVFGIFIAVFCLFYFSINFNVLRYKSSSKNVLTTKINEDNLVLDLRKPLEIEFKETTTISVYLSPENSCTIILPNGKTMQLNPDIIREFRLVAKNDIEKIGIVDEIKIYYDESVDTETLKNEVRNVGKSFDYSQIDIDDWFNEKTKKGIPLLFDISNDDFNASFSVLNDFYKHGEIFYSKRINYLYIRLIKTEILDQNNPQNNTTENAVKTKIEQEIKDGESLVTYPTYQAYLKQNNNLKNK